MAWEVAQSDAMAPHLERIGLLTARDIADDQALDDYVRTHVITFKHPAGTARMGADSDTGAVVDAACRVHGVTGLRVADASVMPTIPRANNNLTCIMIGEKVADLIREGNSLTSPTPGATARA
jgi:choline dehydrogenase